MTPRFKEIPEHWKHPFGPYRQAPEGSGGEWWLVNPFTGAEPWLVAEKKPKKEKLPEGFEAIFGPRPKSSDFTSVGLTFHEYRHALVRWEQDLRHFVQAGLPEWADPAEVAAASGLYERWGMGKPFFFEGRYGWQVRFAESDIPSFEIPAWSALKTSHLAVASYQIDLVQKGIVPKMRHPFVPPHIWPVETAGAEEGLEPASV